MADNVFLKECNVKKTNQYDALDVLEYFKIGTHLYLFKDREEEKDAVFLYFNINDIKEKENPNETDEEKKARNNKINDLINLNGKNTYFKIGILSEEEDKDPIIKFLEARQEKDIKEESKKENDNNRLFDCKVSSFKIDENEDKRIKVAIFIKKK